MPPIEGWAASLGASVDDLRAGELAGCHGVEDRLGLGFAEAASVHGGIDPARVDAGPVLEVGGAALGLLPLAGAEAMEFDGFRVGAEPGGTFAMPARVWWWAAWTRPLNAAELAMLTADPFCMLEG